MLPIDFQFSQSSLQDFADCPRRFELRYIRRLNSPAPQTTPIAEHELHMQRGEAFHRLVQQHLIGIPADVLTESIGDAVIGGWWSSYLDGALDGLPAQRHPEIALSVPFGAYRLIAKYDLLAIEPGQRAVIVDWKTALHRPKRDTLQRKLQTWVYPYVLAMAGAHLNGGQGIAPEQIEMRYWFAGYPSQPEIFAYNTALHQEYGARLETLLLDITRRGDGEFELTPVVTRCDYCPYRSICRRGTTAGDFFALDDDEEAVEPISMAITLDQVAEVEF